MSENNPLYPSTLKTRRMLFPFTFTALLPYPFSFAGSRESGPPTPSPPPINFPNLEPTAGESETPHAGPSRRPLPSRRALHANTATGNEPNVFPSISRKRGWEPSTGVQPIPITTARPVAGDFDTPSKYLGAIATNNQEDLDLEVPPAKRRRLGETIISTALSAALIGTAVGITAYKLWRDRGKFVDAPRQIAGIPEAEKSVEHESPPPYREDRGWLEAQRNVHATASVISSNPSVPELTRSDATPTITKKPHRTRSSRTLTQRKKVGRHIPAHRSSPVLNVAARYQGPGHIAESSAEPDNIEEQMDWMTERLRGLIEQGRQALEKEVVVMVDDGTLVGNAEDQGIEDDGSRDWEDDDATASGSSSFSRAASHLARGVGRFPSSVSISSVTTISSGPIRGLSRPPSSYVLRPSPSFSRSPSSYSNSHSIPIPSAGSSEGDHDRFRDYSTPYPHPMPVGSDDELVLGSPELRGSMERARRARGS